MFNPATFRTSNKPMWTGADQMFGQCTPGEAALEWKLKTVKVDGGKAYILGKKGHNGCAKISEVRNPEILEVELYEGMSPAALVTSILKDGELPEGNTCSVGNYVGWARDVIADLS